MHRIMVLYMLVVISCNMNNAAILTFGFNLYDKIISYYTVLHILQIQMCFYNLLLRQACSLAH
jgi:hypothetical protein